MQQPVVGRRDLEWKAANSESLAGLTLCRACEQMSPKRKFAALSTGEGASRLGCVRLTKSCVGVNPASVLPFTALPMVAPRSIGQGRSLVDQAPFAWAQLSLWVKPSMASPTAAAACRTLSLSEPAASMSWA